MRAPWSVRAVFADPDTLGRQVARARACVPNQSAPALYEAMSTAEIEAEQRLARWERAQRRRHRKRAVRREISAASRLQRDRARLRRQADRQRWWLVKARADRARATSPDALVGGLHHRARRSSVLLRCVIGVGMVWSAVNVGRNLAPTDSVHDLTWWLLWALSFGIEAMISVPILEIMAQAATAARLGQRVDRARIVVFEAALLSGTVGLNCGPHVVAGDFGRAAEYAVAPVMVVVLMWIHAWLARRYADLIDAVENGDDTASTLEPAIEAPEIFSTVYTDRTAGSPEFDSGVVVDALPVIEPIDDSGLNTPAVASTSDEECGVIATRLVRSRRSSKSVREITAILTLAGTGMNANAIATTMTGRTGTTWQRSTIDRIIARAIEMGFRVTWPHLEVVTDRTSA